MKKILLIFSIALYASGCVQTMNPATPLDLALINAVRLGKLEEIRDLIAKGADINAGDEDGRQELAHVAKAGNLAVVKLLLANGACINAKDYYGWSAIMEAARGNHAETVAYLASKGAKVNTEALNGRISLTNNSRLLSHTRQSLN